MKGLILSIVLFLVSSLAYAGEDVTVFYKKISLSKECVAITGYSNYEEVDELLLETDEIKEGVYEISVTRVDSHLYRIDGTSYYIKMPYCYEYCYSEDAILKVRKSYGIIRGTLIWTED